MRVPGSISPVQTERGIMKKAATSFAAWRRLKTMKDFFQSSAYLQSATIFAMILFIGSVSLADRDKDQQRPPLFPKPAVLAPQIEFWKDIFTLYPSTKIIIHDSWYLDLIYEIVDVEDRSETEAWKIARKKKKKYETVVNNIIDAWGKPYRMTNEEKRIYMMLLDIEESPCFPIEQAGRRIRSQTGCADRFRAGLVRSGQYIPMMRTIFKSKNLPEELIYLPAVESAFNPNAVSHAGAAGMWQFMRGTARLYRLKINRLIDDRRDPVDATNAAASLLSDNFKALKSWPLAITAYNHGRQGMKNAVKKMQSDDIGVIVEQYNGRRFSFASRNFYAEFLAALKVCSNYKAYFKDLTPAPPLPLKKISLQKPVRLKDLEKRFNLKKERLAELNPALRPAISRRGGAIPAYYKLNVPERMADTIPGKSGHPKNIYSAGPSAVLTSHTVQKGETLGKIAAKYGLTLSDLMKANNIVNPDRVKRYQVIQIPSGIPIKRAGLTKPQIIAKSRKHLVRQGQTLSVIAEKFNTSIRKISQINGITDPCKIISGQWLLIPEG